MIADVATCAAILQRRISPPVDIIRSSNPALYIPAAAHYLFYSLRDQSAIVNSGERAYSGSWHTLGSLPPACIKTEIHIAKRIFFFTRAI